MCNFKMNQETKRSDEEKFVEFSEHVTATGRSKVLSIPLDSDKYLGHSKCIVQSTNASNSLPVIFQPENICSKSTNSVTEDLDLRLHGDQTVSNPNTREKYRSVAGQETGDSSMNTISTVETVPRERKRWVRPPGVGQATNESPVIIDDLTSSRSVKSAKPSSESQTQSEDNVLPHVLTQSRMTKSGKNTENVEITYDIRNSYYFSPTTMGDNDKKNVTVSNEMKKSEFLQIQDSCKRFVSKSPVFSFPVDVQSGQNQDVNIVGNNDNASGRAPSPASVSSVTSSRRLEWDSGADVGYQTYHTEDGNNVTGDNMSTIERMAFTRGCSARLRMEPEGIAGSIQNLPTLPSSNIPPKVVNISTSISTPLAVSTPLELETVKSSTGTDTESDIMPVVKMPRELYFFPPAQDFDNPSLSQENVVNVENTSHVEENFLSRKISSSLTDLSECGHCEDHKNTSSLPRSQSHLSLLLEENKQKKIFNAVNNSFALRYHQKKNNGLNACSASSSSIATIIPKHESPRVLDKLTQTAISNAPDRQSVAVQVFESRNASECEEKNSLGEENSDSDIINDTINSTNKVGYFSQRKPDISQLKTKMCADRLEMCKGAHKRTYIKKHKHSFATEVESSIADISDMPKEMSKNSNTPSSSENKSENNFNKSDIQWINQNKEEIIEKCSGTLDSIPSSTHTAGSWTVGDALHGNLIRARRDSSGVVGSANSFEYLPGHVYESNAAAVDQHLHKNIIPENSSSQSESSHLSLESRLIKNGSFWDDSTNSTLKNDLEKGINLLRGLLDSKSYSSNSKNKLLRMLMNKLIATDYAEDQVKGVEASWKYVEPDADSQEFVNSNIDERHDENTQKINEREDISGESAGEQQLKSKLQSKASTSAHFVADKCVGTVPSERSGLSSTSDKVCHSDVYSESRVETSTTGGQDGSSSNTVSSKKSCSWKDYTTQSEREYEQHNSKNRGNKSILLKLCETERENQLSWISTEIHHLNSLKQLLEKRQKLSQSLSRREMHERGNHKIKKKLTVYEKNNNMTHSDHSSLQTESRYQSSSNSHIDTPAKYEEHRIRDDIGGNNFKEPKKHHRRREHFLDTKEVRKSSPKKNISIEKTISTQVPSSLNVNDTNRYGIHTKMSRDNVPTPDSESVSYSPTFEVTAGALSDGTAGRINVYGHTLDCSSGKRKDSSKISDHTKNKNVEKCSNADVSSKSSHSDPKHNILCCCECRKLLHKVVSDMKHDKSKIKNVDKNVAEKYKSKNSHLEMKHGTNKNFEYNTSNSCTTTSSGTLQDTPELKRDSDESQYQSVAIGKVNTQTKKHLIVQREHFEEKQLDTKEKCPCCGVDEDFHLDDGNWKCVRCMKLRLTYKVRRCQTCGILESELSDIPGDQNWKCHECLRKELESLEKCIHCGKKQEISNNKAVENHNNTVSSETPAPTSLGYVLTLDTSSRSNSINLNATKTPLQEIKIKIPRKSRQSVSAKEKTQEKLKKNVEKSRPKMSGSKENKKPDTSLQNKSKQIQKHTINVEGRYYTLQEYLVANRPDFIQNAEYRRQCLDEIAYLRELRQNSKYKLLAIASYPTSHLDAEGTSSLNTEFIPPPPLAVKRVFSQRSLRAQTERKYHNLPEILNRKAEKKRKEDYRTNRLMAEIFAKLDCRIKELEYPYKCNI